MSAEKVIVEHLGCCARCGEDHFSLIFLPLTNPADEWTHWVMCPILKEPILLQQVEDSTREVEGEEKSELIDV